MSLTPSPTDTLPARFRHEPDRRAEAARRRRLLREFFKARETDGIALHLRPRLCLDNGRVIGAEARLRWTPRRQNTLRSNAIIALAAQGGDAASLAGWSLLQACHLAQAWPNTTALISVRIPPALQHASLLHLHLAEALETSGLAPERLELRLAEPDLAELGPDELLGLCAIRDLGVGVALEHFGTGATSLALLRRLPLSTITFSTSLFSHVPEDREDSAILRAILSATAALGLESVADGVSSATQRQFLTDIGCNAAQGTLFGPDLEQFDLIGRITNA